MIIERTQDESVSDGDIILQEEEERISVVPNDNIMSLTYSDFIHPIEQLEPVVATTEHDNYAATSSNLRYNLPKEFQVIDLDAPVPILQNMEDADEDFVLLCEFSELEGPIPLITIPVDTLEKTDINLNALSVHVMFTDYQVNTVGQFKICEDTQVMRTNVFKNVHVFMQYFTLYDIKARGFVRPFCFGYVTKDYVKLNQYLEKLIRRFNDITAVLKCSNRAWFQGEMRKYLNKLNNAKDNYPFIRSYTPSVDSNLDGVFHQPTESYNSDTIDLDSCGDTISLEQIEHQFNEIGNILQTVETATTNPELLTELDEIKRIYSSNPDSMLGQVVAKLNFIGNSFEELRLPFVHPLKRKDEPLRPITVLGQFGVILFIEKLLEIHFEFKPDVIFSQLGQLTEDFKNHSTNANNALEGLKTSENEIDEEAIDISTSMTVMNEEQGLFAVYSDKVDRRKSVHSIDPLNNSEICQVLEKLHFSCPIISDDDTRSDSFITLSDDSDLTCTYSADVSVVENETSSYQTAFGSVDSRVIKAESESTIFFPSTLSSPTNTKKQLPFTSINSPTSRSSPSLTGLEKLTLDKKLVSDSAVGAACASTSSSNIIGTLIEAQPASSSSSYSLEVNLPPTAVSQQAVLVSDEESPITSLKGCKSSNNETSFVEIEKKCWWIHASKTKLLKNDPGYGLLKFFRHFNSTAHHVLYSILIGRPVIIFGKESTRVKILQIFNCLIPFIPSYPSKTFKLLQWHQGILVSEHFKNFKLIGLCLPERLTIHDLISLHDSNCITILDYEAKKISGPAYSGQFFENFSNPSFCQTKFFDDLSLLTYIGSILTEIESQVYMVKVMLLENEESDINYDNFKSIPKIMKQLSLKSSDSEIVKYLSHLLISPSDCTEIF